jgi:hypothetical protein
MHLSRSELHSQLVALTFGLMLLLLWLLIHGYHGLRGDAQIYAFQALARINPALMTDLYLQNTSQDQFTVFSSFYALFIRWIGVENAARSLCVLCTLWFLMSAWSLAAALTNRGAAWLAVGVLIIVAGDYGGAGVFSLFENYLTARLLAEAMIITALCCHVRGLKIIAILIAIAALLVHPLMALPGILILICLWLPIRGGLIGALVGILASLCVALSADLLPAVAHWFPRMDADWLDVVRERSQFLFLQLWSVRDWNTNARPLIYLMFIGAAAGDERIRKLCVAGLIVGISGLAIATIAGLIGPVAMLVQGQAWRWVWIAFLLSVLLLPSALLTVWRNDECAPLCTIFLACGWLIPSTAGTACAMIALVIWLLRAYIPDRATPYFPWIRGTIGTALLGWAVSQSMSPISAAWTSTASGSIALGQITGIVGLKTLAAFLFMIFWWWLRHTRDWRAPVSICALLLVSVIFILPAAFKQPRSLALDSDIKEFSDWSSTIPASSTIFVAPARDVGTFVWFTLQRPNYLALDQSAGAVFSRETALEVRRRSENLLPISDPTWRILSGIRRRDDGRIGDVPTRPLTTEALVQVCRDPKLGFVISKEIVAFNHRKHDHDGAWKNWNLYDCTQVRSNSAS